VLRVRLTRFQQIVGGAALFGVLIALSSTGATRWLLLSLLFTLAGLCIGLGVSFPRWQMFGRSLWRIRTDRRVVALTFDDGPDPEATPQLLALLAERGIRATFFCIGSRVAQYSDLGRRLVAEGHEVENHSQGHSYWTNLFSPRRLRADLIEAQREIQSVTGRVPLYFRPPMCLTNPRVFRVVGELGLRVTTYTARGLDRRPDPPGRIAARLLRDLQPGAILLLHDGGVPAERLVAVVKLLLDRLQADGYQCVRLDELATERSLQVVIERFPG
jgi:peptidoglycan/xylan/chitin deacetylase (PgdA/CDA1 family)